jgi:TatD DNase family protein
MNWLDSHCHINDKAFRSDLQEVLDRMAENDVTKAMIISSYLEDYDFALKIRDDRIAFKRSLGIYPGDVDEVDEELFDRYVQHFKGEECIAIGEIGLDYHWQKHNIPRQKEIFARQLEIAAALDKPVIIHSRDAIQDTYDILKAHPCKTVMHCYSDSMEMAKEFVKLGCYISISGTVTWKNAKEPLRVIRNVPLDRLLIETDCPYLTPAPHRGERNEPSFVVHTGRKICEELGLEEESFKKQLNENYHRLFGL